MRQSIQEQTLEMEAIVQDSPLVSKDQAIELKKLGFNWKVDKYYDLNYNIPFDGGTFDFNYGKYIHSGRDVSAPTIEMALKWFRDVKGMHLSANPNYNMDGIIYTGHLVYIKNDKVHSKPMKGFKITSDYAPPLIFHTYEEAQCEGLKFTINEFKLLS